MYSYKLLNTQRSGIDIRTELSVGCVDYWSQCYLCGDWMQSISMAGARLLLLNLQSPTVSLTSKKWLCILIQAPNSTVQLMHCTIQQRRCMLGCLVSGLSSTPFILII